MFHDIVYRCIFITLLIEQFPGGFDDSSFGVAAVFSFLVFVANKPIRNAIAFVQETVL